MAFVPKTIVKAAANQIRNERADKANTATRVGSMEGADVDSAMYGLDVSTYGAVPGGTAAANDAAIALAITDALALSASLWWPPGPSDVFYDVSANIVNFHSVKHRGPGAVRRGSDVYYMEPKSGQTNHIYIAATGSAANDGLSATLPKLTPQNAFDALTNAGHALLDGTWRIDCAAGTWAGTVHRNSHTAPSKNPIIFAGPAVGGHPNVPMAIFDGTVGAVASDWAVRATGPNAGVQIDVRDVKFQNYVGGTDSCGLLVDYGASLAFSNVHGSGSSYSDVYLQGCTNVRGGGGIWASPRGALVNGCVDVTLGYGGVPVRCNGNVNAAIEWSRGTQGHIDNCEFNDCAIAVDVMHDARCHLQGNNFKRSTVAAIRARTGGYYYNDLATPNTFNNGGADKNAVDFLNYVGSGESDEDAFLSQGMRRRAFDKNSHNLTGTTGLTVMSTLLTGAANSRIKAYWFEDNTKKIIVRVTGRFVTAAALSSIGCSLGGIEIDRITLTAGPAANAIFFYECEIEAVGANSQFKKSRLLVDGLNPKLQQNSPTVTTSADLSLTVNGKLAGAGDSMDVFWTEAWLVG